jgi:hypothetical protein
MKSKPWALIISFSSSLLLTSGLAVSTKSGHNPSHALLDLSVFIVGIAGTIAVWAFNFVRGYPVWAVQSWADYVFYFVGNVCFFAGVLWGPTGGEFERWALFFVRLPFFLLIAPIFWLAVIFSSREIPGPNEGFRTGLRMWRGLVNWLLGAPPGYRML